MTFRAALTSLAGLTVPGVAHNYDLAALPDDLSRAQLPALLVLPLVPPATRLQPPPADGFHTLAFSSGPRTVTCTVTHLLLVAPAAAGHGLRSHLPALVDLTDAYLAALAADVTLGGALLEPARVRLQTGTYPYGHADYHAVAFQHTWLIQL